MPRNKRAGTVNVNNDTDTLTITDNGQDPTDMTTATASDATTAVDEDDDEVTFPLESFVAPADYAPNRKSPGRVRRPSYFDDILRDPSVYDGPYQMVPVTSEEHKAFVKREIERAKLFLNGTAKEEGQPEIGISFDLDNEDAVYYRVREAQKRERKPRDADGNVIESGNDDDVEGGESDN